jgi:hypothetical protein
MEAQKGSLRKRKPIKVTHPFPTLEQVRKTYGMSKKRAAYLEKLVRESKIADGTLPRPKPEPRYGYHTVKIKKGVLGEISKIREELEELEDAHLQGVKVLEICELCDLVGAIRAYALEKFNLKLGDLHDMAKLTRRAFEQGYR